MKTLIFIHGGESFTNDADYQIFLNETYISWQSEAWNPEIKSSWVQEIAKKWHENEDQVFMPVFPNKLNARYQDWKIIFKGILSRLTSEDEIIFVGGSLGGCFLLKYFAELTQQNSNFVIPTKEGSAQEAIHAEQMFPVVNMTGTQIQIGQIHLLAACISE
jgi:hypothetical protein